MPEINLVPVRAVAKRCGVEEPTVTKWIRENKIPATKTGKHWLVRSDYLEVFINNQNRWPEDHISIDNKTQKLKSIFEDDKFQDNIEISSIRPIQTFATFETSKKGWSPTRGIKYPDEFHLRVDRIINILPQYNKSVGNFFRDAVYARLLDLEKIISDQGIAFDPKWETIRISELRAQEVKDYNTSLEKMKAAVKSYKVGGSRKEWQDYLSRIKVEVKKFQQPWKDKAKAILMGKYTTDEDDDINNW